MKRSKAIQLMLLASTILVVGACDNDEELDQPQAYENQSECEKDGKELEICENAFKGAKEDHELNAPKFSNLQECEKEFGAGKCYSPNNTQVGPSIPNTSVQQSSFIPMMQGFLIARLLSGNSSPNYHYSGYYSTPGGNLFSGNCDRRDISSSCYVGARGATGRPVYNSSFVNNWVHSSRNTPSISRSSGSKPTVVRSSPITRGGFGGGFKGGSGG